MSIQRAGAGLAGIALMTGSAASASSARRRPRWPSRCSGRSGWSPCASGWPASCCSSPSGPGSARSPAAVAAGAGPRAGLRDHEPVPVHGDPPDRAWPGGDPGVPRPAGGGAARVPAGDRPGVRAGRRRPPSSCWRGRSRPRTTSASGWPCWPPPAGPGYILVQPGLGDAVPAPRDGRRGQPVGAAVRPGRHLGLCTTTDRRPRSGAAAAAGLLCSAVPMVADLQALRRVPARFFGVFMSVNPVFAALVGLVVLRQSLARRLARHRRHRGRQHRQRRRPGQVQSGSVRGRPKTGSGRSSRPASSSPRRAGMTAVSRPVLTS